MNPTAQFGIWAAILLAAAVMIVLWQHAVAAQTIVAAAGGAPLGTGASAGLSGSTYMNVLPQITPPPDYAQGQAMWAASQNAIGYPVSFFGAPESINYQG